MLPQAILSIRMLFHKWCIYIIMQAHDDNLIFPDIVSAIADHILAGTFRVT